MHFLLASGIVTVEGGPSSLPVIEVEGLRKTYGTLAAVDGVSFAVERGEIFGLLGPNGAGKTTTLEILEGLRRPDGGRAVVAGVNVVRRPGAVKARIGVQLQQAGYFEKLTVEETMRLFSAFHRRALPADPLIERFELGEKRRALVEGLSGGQRQRLSLAMALLNDPEVVFLDEPTTGLDPQARRNLWEAIAGVRAEGKTVILTTHYMEEAEALCDRVAIMDRGRILALDTPRALVREHAPGARVTLRVEDGEGAGGAEGALDGLPGAERVTNADGEVTIHTRSSEETLQALLEHSRAGLLTFSHLSVREGTLEDVFLNLTGHRLRD